MTSNKECPRCTFLSQELADVTEKLMIAEELIKRVSMADVVDNNISSRTMVNGPLKRAIGECIEHRIRNMS